MGERAALGLIETRGLVAAIEAADAAAKAAEVRLRGYELVSDGIVAIALTGEVADVRAAVDAGGAAASRVGALLSAHVIPSLGEGMERVVGRGDGPVFREPEQGRGRTTSREGPAQEPAAPARDVLESMRLHDLRGLARSHGVLSRGEVNRSSKRRLIELMLGASEAKVEDGS